MKTTVTLWDGGITVAPVYPAALKDNLKYWRRSLELNPETYRREAVGAYEELFKEQTHFDVASGILERSLVTMPGFASRIKTVLTEAGYEFEIIDKRAPTPTPNIQLALSGLYQYQMECAYKAILSTGGVIACPTGWGKTHIIAAIIKAFDYSDLQGRGTPITLVATPDKDITAKDYEDLTELLPDREVGIIMSGKNKISDDVQVITLDSLHKVNPDDVGIVIVDEVHASASDARATSISAFKKAMKWGVSATPTGRFDGKDLVTEGLFGPVVYRRTYAQGVEDGALVPIVVYWLTSPHPVCGLGRYSAYSTRLGKYRHGVLTNAHRSDLIADIMRRLPEDMQCLCIMQFLEQMNNIKGRCDDDVEVVHAKTTATGLEGYQNLTPIPVKLRREIYNDMNLSNIKKILSTHVYKQGVNFPDLEVVINAGGGGSDIVATQVPGRESRKTANKTRSYMVDFWHPWDTVSKVTGKVVSGPLHRDDKARERAYRKLGFEQIWIENIDQLPFLVPSQKQI